MDVKISGGKSDKDIYSKKEREKKKNLSNTNNYHQEG